MRNVLIVALATIALATVAADAAPHHKHSYRHRHAAPPVAAWRQPTPPVTNRPYWSSPYDCFTDEGYGRFWPCGAGRSD